MGCNDRLAVACKSSKIDHFLLTSALGRGEWAPASLELYSPTTVGSDNGIGSALTGKISGKTRADVSCPRTLFMDPHRAIQNAHFEFSRC